MAVVAGVLAKDMILILAGCNHPVMTAGAGPQHLEVIHLGRGCPQGRAMAGFAGIGGGSYVRVAFAGGRSAVMATLTVIRDPRVIESCR